MFFILLSTRNDLGDLPDTGTGIWTMYRHPLRPSNSCRVVMVAPKILVIAQSPNSPSPFWIWLLWILGLDFGLGLGLGLVKRNNTAISYFRLDSPDDDRQVFRFLVMSEEWAICLMWWMLALLMFSRDCGGGDDSPHEGWASGAGDIPGTIITGSRGMCGEGTWGNGLTSHSTGGSWQLVT